MTNKWIAGAVCATVACLGAIALWCFAVWRMPPSLPDWDPVARGVIAVIWLYVFFGAATFPWARWNRH